MVYFFMIYNFSLRALLKREWFNCVLSTVKVTPQRGLLLQLQEF